MPKVSGQKRIWHAGRQCSGQFWMLPSLPPTDTSAKCIGMVKYRNGRIGVVDPGCSAETESQSDMCWCWLVYFRKECVYRTVSLVLQHHDKDISHTIKCMKRLMREYRSLLTDHNGICFSFFWRLCVCATFLWPLWTSHHLSLRERYKRYITESHSRLPDANVCSMTDRRSMPGSNVEI